MRKKKLNKFIVTWIDGDNAPQWVIVNTEAQAEKVLRVRTKEGNVAGLAAYHITQEVQL